MFISEILVGHTTGVQGIVLFILLLPILSIVSSTLRFRAASRTQGDNQAPPTIPYLLPLLFHAIPLAWNPFQFVTKALARYGWERPLRIRVGWLSMTIVSNPAHISAIFRSSKQLTSKPATLFALQYLLGVSTDVLPFYAADNSGMASTPAKGSTVEHVDRIDFHQARTAQKFLSSQHLAHLSTRYLETLERYLNSLDVGGSTPGEWVEYADLFHFLQTNVAPAVIETMMGSKLLEMSPNLIRDFWAFDSNLPKLMRCFPRWLIPAAFRARDGLKDSIKAWHAYGNAQSDCSKIESEDPEWEPYLGSKLVRARQNYSLKMAAMNDDSRAAEDLGLMMASNGNAVPCVFWFIYEALRNEALRQQLTIEASECVRPDSTIDAAKLVTQPLLQSAYAEVLRLRVGIGMTRVSESEPFSLGGYQIPKGESCLIFSRHPAFNEEAWQAAGRPSAVTGAPLEEFHADRFLVPKKDEELGGLEFSLDGLAGLWLPYGGGQRMCPGRHFAKSEIISTFALLTSRYDMELMEGVAVEPDLRWFPVGALPPAGKLPFRMRRKGSKGA
ncbi:cytochrome P450 [Bombardia bombarda]|uniref:Cytochrome P450 n=1 Tax=Bombardia bombarda TaxID=252184 RepID=A0AA40CAS1_9PEZI|nr:cytochrome P450 [Bombardia bombarda]